MSCPLSFTETTCTSTPPGPQQWQGLRRQLPPEQGFFASSWLEAWAATYLPAGRWRSPCRYLTVRDECGVVSGVFPFATMQFGPFALSAGAGYPIPYRSLPVDVAAIDSITDRMARALRGCLGFRVGLRIGPVSAEDPAAAAFASALRRHGWQVGTRVLGKTFVVDLPSNLSKFNETCRGIIKRASYHERRLRRTGKLEIVRYNALALDAWKKVLADAAAVEKRSWIGPENGFLNFATARSVQFWLAVFSDPFLSASVCIWLMYLDDQPVSFSLQLEAGETTYILANLFDEAFKMHSCGTVLAYHVLRDAIENRRTRIDWGQGDSGYKQLWMAKPGPALHDIIAFRPGLISTVSRAVLHRRSGFVF